MIAVGIGDAQAGHLDLAAALQQLLPRALQDSAVRQQFDKQWASFVRSVKLSGSSLDMMQLMEAARASACWPVTAPVSASKRTM